VTPPDLVFIDVETTGLDPARDRIIDIAAVRVDARLNVTHQFASLVNAGVPVPLFTERLTGISSEHLKGAPSFAEAYMRLLEVADGAFVAGQNVSFDLQFLSAEARRCRMAPPAGPSFDTLEASLLLYPELDRHGLAAMAEHLGLDLPTHRALPDALATAGLFTALCGRAAGLAEPERRLLVAASWQPLQTLDAFRRPPDEAPPPLVAAEPAGPATGTANLQAPIREPAVASPRVFSAPLGGLCQPPRAAPVIRLPVEGADGTHFIDTADIRSVRADAHYTRVHDGTRERMCPWSISETEAQLDPGLFVRVHRSHIVAIPHVSFVRKEGDGAVIELDGPSPHRVPVSRAKIAELKARLGLAKRPA
jgi:DNA polymerase III epsilon subunit-like protein